MRAGAALNLQGEAASLIARHSHAAHILAIANVAFTAVVAALRVTLVLLAIGAG